MQRKGRAEGSCKGYKRVVCVSGGVYKFRSKHADKPKNNNDEQRQTPEQRQQQAAIVVACNMFLYINQLLTKHDANGERSTKRREAATQALDLWP